MVLGIRGGADADVDRAVRTPPDDEEPTLVASDLHGAGVHDHRTDHRGRQVATELRTVEPPVTDRRPRAGAVPAATGGVRRCR